MVQFNFVRRAQNQKIFRNLAILLLYRDFGSPCDKVKFFPRYNDCVSQNAVNVALNITIICIECRSKEFFCQYFFCLYIKYAFF